MELEKKSRGDLGMQIKLIRVKQEMSQERFAKTLGITARTLSRLELGKALPNGKIFLRLIKEFGLEVESTTPELKTQGLVRQLTTPRI